MDITNATTVAALVTAAPAAVAVLRRWGIDLCCDGPLSIAQAGARVNADVEALLVELQGAVDAAVHDDRWWEAGLPDLIANLQTLQHPAIRQALDETETLMGTVLAHHGAERPEVLHPLRDTFESLASLVQDHFERQRTALFPHVRPDGGVDAVAQTTRCLRRLDSDQATIEHALETLREITHGYAPPDGACGAWRALHGSLAALEADVRELLTLERDVLFLRVRRAVAEASGHLPPGGRDDQRRNA